MEIRVWNSYSCNNSSSYYLVARFESEELATDVANELRIFLETHAEQKDDLEDWEATTEAQAALGNKYGFDYTEYLGWGDCELLGDEPSVGHADKSVVIYHSYCGGLEDGLGSYLSARGAEITEEDRSVPPLAAMFHLTPGLEAERAFAALESFFAQRDSKIEFYDFEDPFWKASETMPYGEVAEDVFFWCDGETGGFHMPFNVGDLDAMKSFLEGSGFTDYRLLLCESSLKEKLRTLSSIQQCPECKSSKLKYIEADSSMPEDQVACRGCGGMFAMATIEGLQPIVRIGDRDQLNRVVATGESLLATSWRGSIWRHEPGADWKEVKKAKARMWGIHVLLSSKVVVCGAQGAILFSSNQGKTWQKRDSGVVSDLWGIAEAPGGALYVCGNAGSLITSEDGGKTWQFLKAPVKQDLLHIVAPSDQVLYVCTRNGKVLRSNNAGKSWKRLETGVERPLCRLHAFSEDEIVVVGDGGTILTTKDGASWKKRSSKGKGDIEDLMRGNDGRLYGIASTGTILVSANKGVAWDAHALPVREHLWGLCSTPSGTIVAVGSNGTVARVEDLDSRVAAENSKVQNGASTNTPKESEMASTGKSFLFTGKLSTLSRAEANAKVVTLGGIAKSSVTKDLDYLVVGDEGSPLFGEGKRGSKLVAADKLIAQGAALQIISETAFNGMKKLGGAKKVASKAAPAKNGKTAAKAPAKKAVKAPATKAVKAPAKNGASKNGKGRTEGKTFLFTGKLSDMSRAEAKEKVAELGGIAKSSVTKDLDYLVIGDEGSPLFGEGKKGSKMVAAEKLIADGAPLAIISESDFRKLKRK